MSDETETTRARLRSVMRWLLAGYGAVALALVAGVQLKDLPGIDGDRALTAYGGLALALAGVTAVLFVGHYALTVGRISVTELTKPKNTPSGTKNPITKWRLHTLVKVAEAVDNELKLSGPRCDLKTLQDDLEQSWDDYHALRRLALLLENRRELQSSSPLLQKEDEALNSQDLFWFAKHPVVAESPTPATRAHQRAEFINSLAGRLGPEPPPVKRLGRLARIAACLGQNWSTSDPERPPSTDSISASQALQMIESATANSGKILDDYTQFMTQALNFASDELVKRVHRATLGWILGFSILAAVGIGLFAAGTNAPPAEEGPRVELTWRY